MSIDELLQLKWLIRLKDKICCLQETHFRAKGTQKMMRGWKNIFHAN